jgi:Lon protease-like protein
MAEQLLPLFPLSVVLLPAMPLPLHIFEDRYKEMMADIIASHSEFGVVLAKDEGIVNIGCTASVINVLRKYPDGRLDLLAAGQRRFRIEALDQEKAYLRASVEYFDDEDVSDVPTDLRNKAGAVYKKLADIERPDSEDESDPTKASRLSFHMARFISDLDKRQTVLALRSEVERLQYLIKVVPQYLAQQEHIALAKRLAPQNGHAKHVISS